MDIEYTANENQSVKLFLEWDFRLLASVCFLQEVSILLKFPRNLRVLSKMLNLFPEGGYVNWKNFSFNGSNKEAPDNETQKTEVCRGCPKACSLVSYRDGGENVRELLTETARLGQAW